MLDAQSALEETDPACEVPLYKKYVPTKFPTLKPEVVTRNSMKKRPLTMKNGSYRVVLLAGGPRDLARSIREKLARSRGLYVKYHSDPEHRHSFDKPIPDDVDLVILLTDFIGHPDYHKMFDRAKAQNIRMIRTTRKQSTMVSAMHQHGIHAAPSLPEDLISVMQFNDDVPTTSLRIAEPEPEPVAEPVAEEPQPVQELLTLVDPTADMARIADEATVPLAVPNSRRGLPSPRLAAIAAVLNAICAEEGVTVLLDGKQMQITAA